MPGVFHLSNQIARIGSGRSHRSRSRAAVAMGCSAGAVTRQATDGDVDAADSDRDLRAGDVSMHTLRFSLATTIGLAASACAVDVKDAMKSLEGQPLSALVAKLGPPLDERTVSGKTVFTWGTPDPTFPGQFKEGERCQIKATMNGDRIAKLEYHGNDALCARYTARLRLPRINW
jgi:hypothetical protein